MKKILLFTAFSLLAWAGPASAQLIGVDFNNDSNAPTHDTNDPGDGISPTYPDKGVLGEIFIGVNAAGTGIKLSDGVTMDLTATGSGPSFRDQPTDGTNDLFRDFIQADLGETLTVTLHGLSPKTAYKLVGYGASSRSRKDTTIFGGALVGTAVGSVNGTRVPRDHFVLNQNYVEGVATTDATGSLSFTVTGTSNSWPVLNGFGLVLASKAPPEPAPVPAPAAAPSTNTPSSTP